MDNFDSRLNFFEYFDRLYKIRQFIRHEAQTIKNDKMRILDFGCGTGRLLHDLRYMFRNAYLVGYDIDSNRIEQCKAFSDGTINYTCEISHVTSDDSFDLIMLNTVITSIDEEQLHSVVQNLKSLVTDVGLILIYDDCLYFPGTRKKRFLTRKLIRNLFPEFNIEYRSTLPIGVRTLGRLTNNQFIHSFLSLLPLYSHKYVLLRRK